MQMGPKEIARDYRTAANKQKQIKVLAELNQCAERKIAEILAAEGEELPKKYQEKLQKPTRRSRKFPEEPAEQSEERSQNEPETAGPAPVSPADYATDRDLFEAVATLLPEAERQRPGENGVPVAPRNEDEARHWVDGVGPVPVEDPKAIGKVTLDPSVWDRAVEQKIEPGGITAERLLRAACRLMASALALSPDDYHTYSCGVLDLVHAMTEEEV